MPVPTSYNLSDPLEYFPSHRDNNVRVIIHLAQFWTPELLFATVFGGFGDFHPDFPKARPVSSSVSRSVIDKFTISMRELGYRRRKKKNFSRTVTMGSAEKLIMNVLSECWLLMCYIMNFFWLSTTTSLSKFSSKNLSKNLSTLNKK